MNNATLGEVVAIEKLAFCQVFLPRAKLQVRRGPRALPDDVSKDDGQVRMEQVQEQQDDGQATLEQLHVIQDDGQVTRDEVHVTEYDGQAHHDDDDYDTPVIFQDFGCIMLNRMLLSKPVPRENAEGTMPDSTFISGASSSQATTRTTTSTNDDNLTMKLMKMKRDKERQMAARRDAALEAMNEMAERRAEEAEARRQQISMRKVERQQEEEWRERRRLRKQLQSRKLQQEKRCITTRERSKSN